MEMNRNMVKPGRYPYIMSKCRQLVLVIALGVLKCGSATAQRIPDEIRYDYIKEIDEDTFDGRAIVLIDSLDGAAPGRSDYHYKSYGNKRLVLHSDRYDRGYNWQRSFFSYDTTGRLASINKYYDHLSHKKKDKQYPTYLSPNHLILVATIENSGDHIRVYCSLSDYLGLYLFVNDIYIQDTIISEYVSMNNRGLDTIITKFERHDSICIRLESRSGTPFTVKEQIVFDQHQRPITRYIYYNSDSVPGCVMHYGYNADGRIIFREKEFTPKEAYLCRYELHEYFYERRKDVLITKEKFSKCLK